jgi:RHS repeat-associated protein
MSAFNAGNSRIQIAGFGYDSAGNLKGDPTTGADAILYDAENKQVSYTKAGVTTQYSYDGDGHRVKKYDVSANVTTVFVYNASGKLIAEYTDSEQPPIGEGGTSYLTTDHLGSTRVVTKQNGSVKARYDYMPFGEEIETTVGGRTAGMGYSAADATKQKFTQKERDNESGLDYFLARYYSPAQGRFTSPDEFKGGPQELWVLGSGDPEKQALAYADVTNPQSLNKYQYGLNSPLRYVDPNGQAPQDSFDNRINQLIRDQLSGKISEEEYWASLRAAGYGGLAGLVVGGSGALAVRAPQIVGLVIQWAARNPDKAQQVVQDLVQISTGSPAPGPAGTLTISTGTRLTATEISTGARLAKQTGTALVQSEHIGAEFVSAAGKTYDAMGGAQAFKHFGTGKQFFDSIVHHVNKSVDHVAIDLKGASEAQIEAVKGFVSGLTKKQQEKIIYVTE